MSVRYLALLFLAAVLVSPSAGENPRAPLTVIAGTGAAGYAGDGALATKALLHQPFHCELDAAGNLYIAEAFNHCVRKIDAKTGGIVTVAGCGQKGYSGDGGPAIKATLNEVYAVAADTNGDLYLVDRLNAVIRKVDGKTGVITTLAGNGTQGYGGDGVKATAAMLREPNDCCLDGKGGLLIADVADWRIRRVDLTTGIITTFAGTGRAKTGEIGNGGPATKAVLIGARAVCVDSKGNTFVCEREGNGVRKIDAAGIITTFAGTAAKGYSGDGGPAQQATFNGPKGIRCDRAGNVYVVDTENHAIRKIDAKTEQLTTVAGGKRGAGPDELDRPHGCVVGLDGSLYITDSSNHRVCKLVASCND